MPGVHCTYTALTCSLGSSFHEWNPTGGPGEVWLDSEIVNIGVVGFVEPAHIVCKISSIYYSGTSLNQDTLK